MRPHQPVRTHGLSGEKPPSKGRPSGPAAAEPLLCTVPLTRPSPMESRGGQCPVPPACHSAHAGCESHSRGLPSQPLRTAGRRGRAGRAASLTDCACAAGRPVERAGWGPGAGSRLQGSLSRGWPTSEGPGGPVRSALGSCLGPALGKGLEKAEVGKPEGCPSPASWGQSRRALGLVWAHAGKAEGRQKGSLEVEGAGVMANWMCHGTSLQMDLLREVSSTLSQPSPWGTLSRAGPPVLQKQKQS